MSIPGIILCDGLGEALGAAAGIFIPGCISCEGFGAGEDTPAGIFIPGLISCDGLGEGDATAAGIFIPGCISCDGTEDGDGDLAGICIPGCIWCDGIEDGDGDVAGICIPGCISCDGLSAELALFMPGFLVAARRILGREFFFFGAVFAFGLPMPGILLMSCPSCCGNALTLIAKTNASTLNTRGPLNLLSCFMISPYFAEANPDSVLDKELRQAGGREKLTPAPPIKTKTVWRD